MIGKFGPVIKYTDQQNNNSKTLLQIPHYLNKNTNLMLLQFIAMDFKSASYC